MNTCVVDAILPIIRSGEYIRISPLTFKKLKLFEESSLHDHHLQCDNNPSFEEFSILGHKNKKYLLEIQESLLINHDQPFLNKNNSFATLHLFNTV